MLRKAVALWACLVGGTLAQDTATVQVEALSLIDVQTGEVVARVQNGDVLDRSRFSDGRLTIVAETEPGQVGTVRFYVDGDRVHQAQDAPFVISGGAGPGEFSAWVPPDDAGRLIAVPIIPELDSTASLSAAIDRGEVGAWFEVSFGEVSTDGGAAVEHETTAEAEATGSDAASAGGSAREARKDEVPAATGSSEAARPVAHEGERDEFVSLPARRGSSFERSGASVTEDQRDEVFRLRLPLERASETASVGGDVLLSHYPSGTVILAVDLGRIADRTRYQLGLKRNGCEAPGEELMQLEPVDAGLGASFTRIAASFTALRYGRFGVTVTDPDDQRLVACATLAIDEHVE